VEGTVREVKRRVRVVASSYRAIDRSVTRWIMVIIARGTLAQRTRDVTVQAVMTAGRRQIY